MRFVKFISTRSEHSFYFEYTPWGNIRIDVPKEGDKILIEREHAETIKFLSLEEALSYLHEEAVKKAKDVYNAHDLVVNLIALVDAQRS